MFCFSFDSGLKVLFPSGSCLRSYKYYAAYTLPGSDDEVQTAAQSAKMQQASGSTTSTASTASTTATWHVPLQHCGVHWVQAGESLAGALAGQPLRLRVYRAHTRGGGGPSAGDGSRGPPSAWVSSSLCGEALVDMSSLVSTSGVRKHQPNTRCVGEGLWAWCGGELCSGPLTRWGWPGNTLCLAHPMMHPPSPLHCHHPPSALQVAERLLHPHRPRRQALQQQPGHCPRTAGAAAHHAAPGGMAEQDRVASGGAAVHSTSRRAGS